MLTRGTILELEQQRRHGLMASLQGMPCTLVHVCAYDANGRISFGTLATLAEHVPKMKKLVGNQLAVVGAVNRAQLDVLAALPVQMAALHPVFWQPEEWLLGMVSVHLDNPTTVPVPLRDEARRNTLRFLDTHRGLSKLLMKELVERRQVYEAIARLHATVPATVQDAEGLVWQALRQVAFYQNMESARHTSVLDALADYARLVATCPGGMGRDYVIPWLKQMARGVPDSRLMNRGVLAPLPEPFQPKADDGWPDTVEAGRVAMRLVITLLRSPPAAFGKRGMTRMIHELPRHLAQAFAFMGAAWADIEQLGYWSRQRLLGSIARSDDAPLTGCKSVVPLQLVRWANLACTTAERVPVPVATGTGAGEAAFTPSRVKVQLPGPAWVQGALNELLGKEEEQT